MSANVWVLIITSLSTLWDVHCKLGTVKLVYYKFLPLGELVKFEFSVQLKYWFLDLKLRSLNHEARTQTRVCFYCFGI